MYGPTVGDRVRLADTELLIEVEHDYTLRAGSYGEEVKFGGGKVIRDGMGQSQRRNGPGADDAVDCVITNALIVDHWGIVKADIGLRGSRIAKIGKAGNPDVQTGRRHRDRPRHRSDRRRRHDRHRRRHRQPHPFHLPAADRRGAVQRHHDDARRRHRPGHRHLRDDLHARAGQPRAHAAGRRRLSDEPRLSRQGQCEPARSAAPADRGRRDRTEAARGLGHHAGGDRLLPRRRRGDRYPGRDPQRYAERIGLRREYDRRDQGPHAVRLPHRRRRRRPRAGHPARRRRGRTSCRRRPIRPCRIRSIRSTSTSTC